MGGPRRDLLLTAAGAALVTLLVAFVPAARLAYREPALHVALETAAGLIALLASLLVFGRFRVTGCLTDLLLVFALGLMATANLAFAAVPAALSGGVAGQAATWAVLACRLVGAATLAVAALGPDRRVCVTWWAPVLAVAAALGLAAGAVVAAEPYLPVVLDPQLSPETSGRRGPVGHPAALVPQVASAAMFAVAAYGFGRRAVRARDHLMRWLAVACVLAAFARVNYFLFPSIYSEWVSTGDAFRLLFYLVVLGGVVGEIRRYWRAQAEVAVLEERRRMARDLHDGLAQELAYIHRNALRLDAEHVVAGRIRASADRALVEARRAIHALSRPLDEPLDVLLAEAVSETAHQHGAQVDLALAPGVQVPPATQEGLLRIACEAVGNAARHAGAQRIRVELHGGMHPLLRISDDGRGFDPAGVPGGRRGFGLVSMQERARSLGGRLQIRSEPGRGTRVEMRL
ncbi:MAG: sensor histidine kinase [Actinomycetota bacterium]|nr:sensor histidine kinase [Actinomycetota bacterium]